MDYYLGYILSVVLSILKTIRNYVRSVNLAWKLSGPPALPILGNVMILKHHEELVHVGTYASQLYGSFFRVWIGFLPAIFIYEPKHLKIIMSTNKNNQKSIFYKALHNFLGQGLITNNGHQWKKNRKMIQPYFSMNILEKFVDVFAESSSRFMGKLEGAKTLKITSIINDCVMDVLHNGVLGVPLDKDSPYRKGDMQAIERYVKPWLLFDSIFNWTSSANSEKQQRHSLYSYTKQILLNRKSEMKKCRKACFLDMFIEIAENNAQFTEEDLINEIVTFMLASPEKRFEVRCCTIGYLAQGQDSVGATLAFSVYFIAKHPEIQEKILKEISVFDVNGKLTIKELNEMKYLEQVIREALRLTPAVPMMTRVLTEDVTLDDTVLPSGTTIFISPFITHRLPHVHPEPLKFDPDRFEASNIEEMHPYAYLPFSLGPRNCIGYKFAIMELKTILFYLLKKYELRLPEGKEDITLTWRATLRVSGGIWISLNSRKT